MVTILSYVVLLSGVIVGSLAIYFFLLKIELI